MGNVKDYYCAECARTGERGTLVRECVGPAKHCPMRNKVEQVDDLLTKPRDVGKILQPLPADPTNPTHYKQGDIECIDAIEAALTPEEFRGFCKGNVLKYTWRERTKGKNESLAKARWYLNRLIGD